MPQKFKTFFQTIFFLQKTEKVLQVSQKNPKKLWKPILTTFQGNSVFFIKIKSLIKICTLFHIDWSNSLWNNYKLIHTTILWLDSVHLNLSSQASKGADFIKFKSLYLLPINFKKIFVEKKCLYKGREKEYSKKMLVNVIFSLDSVYNFMGNYVLMILAYIQIYIKICP